MEEEVREHNGKRVLLTKEWTNRRIVITGSQGVRSAAIHRPLGVEAWGISFTLTDNSTSTIELSEVTEDYNLLIDAGIRFVVDGGFPATKHYVALEKLRQKELDLVQALIKAIKRPPRKPR